jgi:hypothetical protein
MKKPRQKRERRKPDHEIGEPLDGHVTGCADGGSQRQDGDHQEPDGKGIGEQCHRTAQRLTRPKPPRHKHADPSQSARAARNELDALQGIGHTRLIRQLEHAVRPEAAEQHPDEAEADPHDVRSANDRPLHRPLQPATREGEKDVQEEDRWQKVERLPDRVQHIDVRPAEHRQERAETRRDHQRAETILRSPPPSDQPAKDVREDHPNGENGPEAGLAQIVALQRGENRVGSGRASAERDRQEQVGPRRPGEIDLRTLDGCRGRHRARSLPTRARRTKVDGLSRATAAGRRGHG